MGIGNWIGDIPTSIKSQYLYNYIIKEVKNIYINTGHNLEDIPKKFMMDFEASLIKVFKKILIILK